MDENPSTVDQTSEQPAETSAPEASETVATEPSSEQTVPEVSAPEEPAEPATNNSDTLNVPGTPGTPPAGGEQLATAVQPPAGNPVPATAAESTDQVSVNHHLRAVAERLGDDAEYVNHFLANSVVATEVIDVLNNLVTKLLDQVV